MTKSNVRITLVVTFLEKKSMVTLAHMKFGRWNQTQIVCFTPPSCNQPFSNSLHFLERDLLAEHNLSMRALVLQC